MIGALGRVWLAFCSDGERRTLLRGIGVRQRPALTAALDRIRRDGHAFTVPPRPTRIHGMAVPIRERGRDKDRVLGCISMRFPRSAMSEQAVGAKYGPLLTALARQVAADVAGTLLA